MADANNVWVGSINDAAPATFDEERALFQKVFSGEVITAFEEFTTVLDKHQVRTISSGKSASFPVIGRMPAAEYHTPGAEILGQDVLNAERVIQIEKLLISHVFIADIDEAMKHYDVRSKYAKAMGQRLAQTFDLNVMKQMVGCGVHDTPITGDDTLAGARINDPELADAAAATKLAAWIKQLYAAATALDNKYVIGPRYCFLKPENYYFLVQAVAENGFSAIHKDYGGEGSFAQGSLVSVAGIKLIPTPFLPTADYSADDFNAVNCEDVVGVVTTDASVGTVKLMDISLQSEWDIRRQGTLMVARYAMGHGVLQPEAAVVLATTVV
jgi:hypothetical protein